LLPQSSQNISNSRGGWNVRQLDTTIKEKEMLDMPSFVNEHERALYNFAMQLTRSEDEARDLLQDTWLKCLLHQQLLITLPVPKQRSWLFTVLKNRWLDICRRRKLERLTQSTAEYTAHAMQIPLFGMDAHLEKLPAIEKEIVRQRFWLERNSREIAETLGIPEGTVRWRLKRAMDKLRRYIEQSD